MCVSFFVCILYVCVCKNVCVSFTHSRVCVFELRVRACVYAFVMMVRVCFYGASDRKGI